MQEDKAGDGRRLREGWPESAGMVVGWVYVRAAGGSGGISSVFGSLKARGRRERGTGEAKKERKGREKTPKIEETRKSKCSLGRFSADDTEISCKSPSQYTNVFLTA